MLYFQPYLIDQITYPFGDFLLRVASRQPHRFGHNIKNGHQTVCTIVAKLSDPDAIGDERVVIRDATFDKLTLMDWEAKKLTEDSYDFTFTDYDILDEADE